MESIPKSQKLGIFKEPLQKTCQRDTGEMCPADLHSTKVWDCVVLVGPGAGARNVRGSNFHVRMCDLCEFFFSGSEGRGSCKGEKVRCRLDC